MIRRKHSDFSWFVIFVGCVFLTVGGFFFYGIIERFYVANRLSNAVEVQANVLEVDLKTSSGGGRSGGGGSRTIATYEFKLDGATFRSDRLSIFANSGFLYQELKQAKDSDLTVACFVDPSDPSVSALHRDFAWWPFLGIALLAVVFGGIGIACFIQEIRNLVAACRAGQADGGQPLTRPEFSSEQSKF